MKLEPEISQISTNMRMKGKRHTVHESKQSENLP